MPSSTDSDYLYSVGVDLAQATGDLREWASATVPGILNGISGVNLKVNYSAASANVQRFVNTANDRLNSIKPVTMKVSLAGASQSLNALMKNFSKQSDNLQEFQERLQGINSAAESAATGFGGVASQINGIGNAARSGSSGAAQFGDNLGKISEGAGKAAPAMDYLGRLASATMFKFVEWDVIIQSFNAVISGFKNSLQEAGEVQMEMVLQKLYNLGGATGNVGQAFKNASEIARQWGGDIIDIQQAIGLWTKQTNDLAAATYLANQGEMLSRASGISTLEVYKDSLAIATQMGITYGALPGVYDQITRAALRLGEPLRSLNKDSAEGQEAIKDLMQGLHEASATLSANSFRDTASIIALVSNQITAMGNSGKNAAENLSTMFGALSQGGKKRAEWESILGVDAFKNADSLLQAMKAHLSQLTQAQANGLLGVRPAQVETLATMEKSLDHILQLYGDISTKSKGSLQLVAVAEMDTYQAKLAQLGTAIQALEIQVGTQLLPTFQSWAQILATQVVPEIQTLVPEIINLGNVAVHLGAAFLAWQVGVKAFGSLNGVWTSARNGLLEVANAEALAQKAGFATAAEMNALKLSLAEAEAQEAATAEETAFLSKAYATLGDRALLTSEQMERVSAQALATGNALNEQRAAVQGSTEALGAYETQLAATTRETGIFADEEVQAATKTDLFKTSLIETQAVAGNVGIWRTAVAGIMSIGAAAVEQLGPLAAMYAAMEALENGAKGGNRSANASLAVRNYFSEAAGNSQGPSLQGLGDLSQSIGAWLQGKGYQLSPNAAESLITNMDNPKTGSQGFRDEFATWQKAVSEGNNGRAQEMAQAMGDTAEDWVSAQSSAKQLALFNARMAAAAKSGEAALGKSPGLVEGGHTFAQTGSKAPTGNAAASATAQQTQAYDAAAKAALSYAAAQDTEIQRQETIMAMNGPSLTAINAINVATQKKAGYYNQAAVAAETYIAKLKAELATDQATVASSTSSSKQKTQALANEKTVENDLTKAEGTLADMESKRNQAVTQGIQLNTKYMSSLVMTQNGVSDYKKQIDNLNKSIANTQGYAAQHSAIVLGEADVNRMNVALQSCLNYVEQHFPKNTTLINFFKQALADTVNEGNKLAKEADQDAEKITAIGDAIQKMGGNIAVDNFKSLANIFGIDRQTVDYVTQMVSGMDQIKQDQDEINAATKELDKENQSSLLPEDKQLLQIQYQQIANSQAELNIKKALLPLEQQILAVRSSTAYQAWNSEIQSMGQSGLDNIVKNMFTTGGSANSIGGVVKQFFGGIMTNMVDSWWKSAASQITDGLFGASGPEGQLKSILTTTEGTLNKQFGIFGSTVSGPLTTGFTSFANSANTIKAAAAQLASAVGGGAGGAPGGAIPGVWDSNGDSYTDAFDVSSSQVSQSFSDIALTANASTAANDLLNTANDTLSSSEQYLSQIADSFTSLSGSGAGGGGGGGLLGGLLSLFGLGGGGSSAGGAGGGASGLLSMFTGSYAGILTGALGIGSLVGGIAGAGTGAAGQAQHTEYGMAGAAAGAVGMGIGLSTLGPLLPLLMANPLLGALFLGGSALLGGAIGSLFGDHFPIGNEPDIGEPTAGSGQYKVSYGQFTSNMIGTTGSYNGQTINAQAPYNVAQGGTSESMQLWQQIQSTLNSSTATAQQKQEAQQLMSLADASNTKNGGLGIASEKDDMFTLYSGQQVNVEKYMSEVQQFMGQTAQNTSQTAAAIAPILSINAYGSNGKGLNPYNTPGMTNSDFEAFVNSKFSSWNPYGTPGVGNGGTGGQTPPILNQNGQRNANGNVTQVIQLKVDGKTLAQIVNAWNAESLLNSGKGIDNIPPLH